MKNICLILLFSTVPLFAQQTTHPFTPDQQQEAKQQLRTLGKAFGLNPQATNNSSQSDQKDDHKTMGDVADKALDMVGNAVSSISQTVENVAPHIWRVLVIQQYAKAIGNITYPLLVFFAILIFSFFLHKKWKNPEADGKVRSYHTDDYWCWLWFGVIIPIGAGTIFFLIFAYQLSQSIQMLINPEYFAVRDLLQMLLGYSTGQ